MRRAVLVLVLLVLSAGAAIGQGRYVEVGRDVWAPAVDGRVFSLPDSLGVLPDKIVCNTTTGNDWYMGVVTRGDAASDTTFATSATQRLYLGGGEGIANQPVFLVSDSLSDSLVIRAYKWVGR